MVKELCYRGFEIVGGDLECGISYKINKDGIERVSINGNKSSITIWIDDEKVNGISIINEQADEYFNENQNSPFPIETNFQQAIEIYRVVKRILDVDNKIKEYVPRFSSESELTLFNILGIEEASQLEKFVRGEM